MLGKREDAWDRAKKIGVNVLSAWTSVLDHLVFYVVEASSQEAASSILYLNRYDFNVFDGDSNTDLNQQWIFTDKKIGCPVSPRTVAKKLMLKD